MLFLNFALSFLCVAATAVFGLDTNIETRELSERALNTKISTVCKLCTAGRLASLHSRGEPGNRWSFTEGVAKGKPGNSGDFGTDFAWGLGKTMDAMSGTIKDIFSVFGRDLEIEE